MINLISILINYFTHIHSYIVRFCPFLHLINRFNLWITEEVLDTNTHKPKSNMFYVCTHCTHPHIQIFISHVMSWYHISKSDHLHEEIIITIKINIEKGKNRKEIEKLFLSIVITVFFCFFSFSNVVCYHHHYSFVYCVLTFSALWSFSECCVTKWTDKKSAITRFIVNFIPCYNSSCTSIEFIITIHMNKT